ncbi:MAG: phosphate/phosphite/phosphonate ABC transporter substrate-binding protein [Marinobacterium sp.]|nr:phosphate/phosphite/phosphonate ABC transporter substrate-binding protein [Marinobacterium sp.]
MRSVLFATALFTLTSPVLAETLTFGVVPQQSAKKLAKKWTPILRYLSAKTGDELRFSTAKNIPTFEKRLAAGQYDFAYMNPYHYTVFHQDPGYEAFARQKNKRIKGIVVVRKDSPLTELTELAGQALAFPSPAAFAASVLPRARLTNDGIPFKASYVSSHDSVYLNVARGYFPAGGGVMRTFNNTDPAVREQLKILWTTHTYTPHAFAAHPSVSPAAVERLRVAMIAMNDDPEGQVLLKSINFKGMQAARNSDWDDVRALGLNILDKLIRQ